MIYICYWTSKNANINIVYEYDDYQTQGTLGDTTDDTIEKAEKEFSLTFNGIRINTLKNSLFDAAVQEQLTISINDNPSNRLYVQSGTFLGKIRLFGDEEQDENELIEDLRGESWLVNEANLIFYIDPALANTKELLAQRLYLFNYDTGFPLSDYISDGSVFKFWSQQRQKYFWWDYWNMMTTQYALPLQV